MRSIVAVEGKSGARGQRAQSLRDEVRHLWSRLQVTLSVTDEMPLRLAFCSTHAGEGATSVAANFSIFLGEQDRRTCLVEANLRTPRLAEHFRVAPTPGLCELLDENAQLKEAMRRDVAPLVDLVPAGVPPRDVYALFGNNGLVPLFGSLRSQTDVVVVDVPPLAAAPEAGPILQGVDLAILVVQAHRTRRQSVAKSLRTFEELGVPLGGIVLNRVSYDLPPLVEHVL